MKTKTFKVKGIPLKMVWIPEGEFMMGSPKTEKGRYADEEQHKVSIDEGFWMMETEVTQELYKVVMGSDPSYFKGKKHPVETVSWHDANIFNKKLNEILIEELEGGNFEFDLPTEAQWEYACRAGTTTSFNTGSTLTKKQACINAKKSVPVKSYKPNAWGLYDMHGNVWEWCIDEYKEDYGLSSEENEKPIRQKVINSIDIDGKHFVIGEDDVIDIVVQSVEIIRKASEVLI